VVSSVGANKVVAEALAGFGGSTVSVTPADIAIAGEGGSICMAGAGGELLVPESDGALERVDAFADSFAATFADALVLLRGVAGSVELPLPQPVINVTPARAIPIAMLFI
jgi:hypothetical protein